MDIYKIKKTVVGFLRPYATAFFCYSPWIGLWFALISFCTPRTAFAGLFCLICAWVWGKLLAIKPPGDLHLVNGLLSGLFLSANYPLSTSLFIGLALLALFVTISVNWLTVYMWYMGKIPLMTLPFVLGTWLVIIVFHEENIPSLPSAAFLSEHILDTTSWSWLNDFFSAMGGLMLVPYPLTGALMFLALFLASRYLAFLAASGYIVGALTLHLLGYDDLIVKSGYNFMLVTIALGGIFMVPSFSSYLISLGGSALSCLFVIALFKLLDPWSIPVLVMPFLLSTYFWIGGLGPRIDKTKGLLYLDAPISPEIAWDNARLSKARGMNLNEAPTLRLFQGEWLIEYNSIMKCDYFSRAVSNPKEELIILSPAEAIFLSSRNTFDLSSGAPWEVALSKEWGDFILMRDRLGQYILLARLQPQSIIPKPNEWVTAGQPIAKCGKSEDNAKFCLYIQYQMGPRPASDRIPYHLVNVLSYKENQPREFHLFYYPVAGDYVSQVERDADILAAIHLPPGIKRTYRIKDDRDREYIGDTQTGMTSLGQSRIYASKDCSVAYELSTACLTYYDKQGKRNTLLDVYLLGLGVTPLTTLADTWTDEPSIHLWPLNLWQRLFLAIVRPLGLGCKTRYTRIWDEKSKQWMQNAIHRAHIIPGVTWEAKTSALLDPAVGMTHLKLEMFGKTWEITRET